MIALLAWHHICVEKNLKPNLIPQDIATQWNSTYDMLHFAIKYWDAIDGVTVDKSLKMRKFKLDNDDWTFVEDLVSMLEVCLPHILLTLSQ